MKKWIFTLTLTLLLAGFTQAQVIFDPDTYAGTLPAGMSKDTINGTVYLRVILNQWSSSITIPQVAITAPSAKATIKYKLGPDTDSTLTNANINGGINLKDTANKVENQWNPGEMVASQTSLTQSPTSGNFGKVQGDFLDTMKYVHEIQFFGQVTQGGWPATSGDTIWVGKIVGFDSKVIFDPATFDTTGTGFKVVEESGTMFLKATVNEWNTAIYLEDTFNMGENNKFSYKIKLDPGTSGKPIDSLNTIVRLEGSMEQPSQVNDQTGSIIDVKENCTMNSKVTAIRLVSQYKAGSWPGQVGAIIYISKITVSRETVVSLPPQRVYVASQIPSAASAIVLNGIDDDDAWDGADADSGDIKRPAIGTPGATDSEGQFYAVWDDENIYFYVDITDDVPRPFPSGSDQYWNNDGIELFIDAQDGRYEGSRIEGQHQYRINLGRTEYDMGPTNHTSFPVTWGELAGNSGYGLEVKMPFANMFMNAAVDSATALAKVTSDVKNGYRFSFEISILDADAADNTRESILNWANPTGTDVAYTTSQYYGQIQLGDETGFVGVKNRVVQNTIRIVPNPARENLRIAGMDVVSYSIIDITGRMVDSGIYNGSISVASLKTGIYIIQTLDKDGAASIARFVKN
ncbi:MAG: T9SS type A sorting domain-containing protein [Bacteroidales bacterium]|nr:T9SS type A sorting domain-containing protein [Bacteroidales bacterium]